MQRWPYLRAAHRTVPGASLKQDRWLGPGALSHRAPERFEPAARHEPSKRSEIPFTQVNGRSTWSQALRWVRSNRVRAAHATRPSVILTMCASFVGWLPSGRDRRRSASPWVASGRTRALRLSPAVIWAAATDPGDARPR